MRDKLIELIQNAVGGCARHWTVIKPVHGGGYIRLMELVYYDVSLKGWECEGMIITHWMPMPEPPKEGE